MEEMSTDAKVRLQLGVWNELGGPSGTIEDFVELRSSRTARSISSNVAETTGNVELDLSSGKAAGLLGSSFDHLLIHIVCPGIEGRRDGFWCKVRLGEEYAREAYYESDRRSHNFLVPISLLASNEARTLTVSATLNHEDEGPPVDFALNIQVAACRQQSLFSSIARSSVFVFSTARSGSTWLGSEILCWGKGARVVDEPGYGMLFAPLQWDAERYFDLAECNYYIRSGLAYETGLKPRSLPREIAVFDRANAELQGPSGLFNIAYQQHFRRMVRSAILEHAIDVWGVSGYRRLVFKMPNESHAADFIAAALPEARIIHLVRDGRDVLSSRFGSFGSEILSATKNEALRKYAVSFFSHFWNFQNDIISDACSAHAPERAMFIRYEDLRQDLRSSVFKLYEWIGASLTDQQIETLVKDVSLENAPRDEVGYGKRRGDGTVGRFNAIFSGEEIKLMNKIMGPSLTRYGYSVQDEIA